MLYEIVQDMPGRLRLRCGRSLFDKDEALGVVQGLCALEGVQDAAVHPANGSILVVFEPRMRAQVLAYVDALDVLHLPQPQDEPTTAQALELQDNEFQTRVTGLVLRKLAKRLLLPAPVRMVLTIVRSIPFILKGLSSLVHGQLKVEVLDAAALIAAMGRGAFSDAGTVMFLLELSDIMCEHVEARAKLSLQEGLVTRSESVWLVRDDGTDVRISTRQVKQGQLLHMHAGTVLPIDGTVEEGDGMIDEASMTGESRLVHKEAGSTVFAGTALEDGDLKVRVIAPPGKARIDSIVRMVEQSSTLKASVQSKAERLADGLVPYSFLAFFAIWGISRSIAKAMVVLMVDYSCAVKVSTPIAVMSAMQEAMEAGAVVKGGKYLEALAAADAIVFDKTGTLTQASPAVERVISFGDVDRDTVLRYAACVEEHFPHSLARAIVRAAKERGLHHEQELHAKVNYVVAHGISTTIDGIEADIGSAHFLFEDLGVEKPEGLDERIEKEAPTASVVYLAWDKKLMGAICIADPIRAGVRQTLAHLRAQGISQMVMLTGDGETAARAIATELGLDAYHAQVLPEDKSRYVKDLQDEGHTVMMVGDGINDSPALAQADVSVALSDASDIARAVADVSVLDDSLDSLVTMRELSVRLMERIRRDYHFIVIYNSLLIAGGVAGILSLTASAYLHNIATVSIAVANTRPYLRQEQRLPQKMEAAVQA